MPTENKGPITPEEYQKLLHALELVCQNVDRLLTQGIIVTESSEDDGIEAGRRRIDNYRDQIERERKRVKRIQSVVKRRKDAGTKRNKSF